MVFSKSVIFCETNLLHGFALKFISEPTVNFRKNNSISAVKHHNFVDREIESLLISNSIQEVSIYERDRTRINPISVAEGKKLRLILDLSVFNKSLKKASVKYEDAARVLPLLPKGGFMASFELHSGYHHVRMHKDFSRFLGFQWGKKVFKFLVLPFGLSPAPFVFTKLMKPLLHKWRAAGLFVAIWTMALYGLVSRTGAKNQ